MAPSENFYQRIFFQKLYKFFMGHMIQFLIFCKKVMLAYQLVISFLDKTVNPFLRKKLYPRNFGYGLQVSGMRA